MASSLRSMRSVRQSRASSTAARRKLPGGEGVRHAARKADDRSILREQPNLLRALLHHGIAEGNLAVGRQGDLPVSQHRDDGGRSDLQGLAHAFTFSHCFRIVFALSSRCLHAAFSLPSRS